MEQTGIGSLQYINTKNVNDRNQGMNAASDFVADKYNNTNKANVIESETGYKYDRETNSSHTSIMDNFEEYLKAKNERAKEENVDEESRAREEKEAEKELLRKLSSEEIKKLTSMGIDVLGAKLSDLLGIVNTMRSEAHKEELTQIIATANIEKGNTESITMVSGSAKVGGAEINLSKNELVYIMQNNMKLSRESIYKAHYSGSIASKEGVPQEFFDNMRPQIDRVVEQAGLAGEEKAVEAAKFLLDNNVPVTTDNIRLYYRYTDNFSGKNTAEIDFAALEEQDIERLGEELAREVSNINPDVVAEMAGEDREITLASIKAFTRERLQGRSQSKSQNNTDERASDNIATDNIVNNTDDLKTLTVKRQLEEIRFSMTASVATKLLKWDINIDTRELSKVVNQLKKMENQRIMDKLSSEGIAPTEENIALYNEVNSKIYGLKDEPAGVIAAPLKGAAFTVNALYHESRLYIERLNISEVSESEDVLLTGSGVSAGDDAFVEYETVGRNKNTGRDFAQAVSSYEAVGTAPRADMGDRISKAFRNVGDILAEMGMADDYENERAVRILGYNSMEITVENIEQVKVYDRQVNQLVDTFYPEAVLSLIKDGINPLDVPIDELNQIIRNRNYNEGVSEAENFAAYLRDMEKQGLVSPEERESYIGLYRVMDKLAKSGDREAGWIFAKGENLTVRNIISAMRSRRAAGMDVAVDDDFGMLVGSPSLGKNMEKQIESAFADFNDILSRDYNSKNANEAEKSESEYDDSRLEMEDYIESASQASDEVWTFIEENQIEASAVNVMAAKNILENQAGIYGLVSEILGKLKFKTNAKDELIDEETENMTDSLSGDEVALPFETESILESFRGSEEMSLKYDDLRDRLTELMYGGGITGAISSMDISAFKTASAGLKIMSHMAKNNRFRLPVETNQGVRVVNVTVVHSDNQVGTIDISMDGGELGTINAKITAVDKNAIAGYIISSTSDGNYDLAKMQESFDESLEKAGYDASRVSLGRMEKNVAAEGDEHYTSGENPGNLYHISVSIIKALGSLI